MKKNNIRKKCLTLVKYVLLLAILVSSYIILMMLTSLIPTKLLTEHVKQSSEVLVKEGEKKVIDLKYKKEAIFTFTDALMINITYSQVPSDPLASALLGRKNYIPNQTEKVHIDSQYNLGAAEGFINKKNGDLYQTKELYALMHGENITDSFEYARYWHGYTTILRPLLVITNYSGIRVIILVVTIFLVLALLYKLYKTFNIEISIIFFIGLMSVSIFTVTQGINEILVFLIALITSLILLYKKEKTKGLPEIFFIVGSITNFLDLLTAPLVTLGIPLIISILLLQKDNKNLKQILLEGFKLCAAWSISYFITWLTKWIITQEIYGRPIVTQAFEQIRFRTGTTKSSITFTGTIAKILNSLSKNVCLSIITLLIIYTGGKMILQNKKIINVKNNLKNAIPYVIIAVFPIIWYFVIKQHSFIHSFFTYRILIITTISIFVVIDKLFENSSVKDE